MLHKLQILALAALALFAIAGCGGASQSQQPLALVAAADPICERVAAQSTSANASLHAVSTSTAKTLQVLARVAPGVASSEHHAVTMLDALRQNGWQTGDWHTMLLGMRQLADASTRLATAAKARNIGAVHKIVAEGVGIQRELAVIASRDGFAYCGRAN